MKKKFLGILGIIAEFCVRIFVTSTTVCTILSAELGSMNSVARCAELGLCSVAHCAEL
jgi:hypothetical protein